MTILPFNSNYFQKPCNLCPRNCNIDRQSSILGYCKTNTDINIASITIHHGEEPAISENQGICNVFFSGCNLRCVYCQNFQISQSDKKAVYFPMNIDDAVNKIINILDTGINSLGFVSPSHCLPQMVWIIDKLHKKGRKPIIVYNSNAYDKVENIRLLDGVVDVYLPDFKYMLNDIAFKFSGIKNYSEIALASIKEMYRQKGNTLIVNENGYAESGMIIRHLVLPNNIDNSKAVIKAIAENISENIHISLMSQYYPTHKSKSFSELNRIISKEEYMEVVDYFYKIGLHKGWIQDFESAEMYRPDFDKKKPF